MNFMLKAGIASAALAAAAIATPTIAADLAGPRGSLKDPGYAPMPVATRGAAGPCYFRADVGYSRSDAPTTKWPVTNIAREYTAVDPADRNTYTLINESHTFAGDNVSNVSIDNTWFGEAGVGCGSGSYGVRGEVVLGYRGERKIDGAPNLFTITETVNTVPGAPTPNDDPLHTTLRTYTMMANVYKDFGNFGGFTPDLGAGIGLAYHQIGDVYFTGNPALVNRIKGDNDLAFAWALMAGVGFQVSDRAILDVGYRYIDLGKAASGRVDSAGFANPRVTFDDLTAHEVKVGLRYHFGSNCCEQPSYAPMK
jgi:opacity protein-like surface antigen